VVCGVGAWCLGFGGLPLRPTPPNPKPQTPNPQSPIILKIKLLNQIE